jgi:2-polyprenyl-3-methyl-5-hydroxy-6-metoxy-1,4-benzoquinol methylase
LASDRAWWREHSTVPETLATLARDCPACGARPTAVIGRKDGCRLYRCGQCTLQYAEQTPSDASLPALYDERYFNGAPEGYPDYVKDEPVHRRRARGYLCAIARHVAQGRLLDVGCATGFFLDEARRAGWQVHGCEVSEWAAAYARDVLQLDVTVGPFPSEALAGRRFDVVTFFNVFEQLPDPRATERALRDLVQPGGVVAIETWDADALIVRLLGLRWHQYRPRETPIYLNRRSLRALFPPEHWELLTYRSRAKGISLRNGLHVLGIELPPPERGGGAAWLGGVTVPYRLGDLVWAVLRRRADG